MCPHCDYDFRPNRSSTRCDACDRAITRVERLPRLEALRRLLDLELAVRRFRVGLQVAEEPAHALHEELG